MCAMACATSLKSRSASGLLVPPTCSPLSLKTTTATATDSATCSSSLASWRFTGRLYRASRERRAHPDHHARAVLAIERLGGSAVEFGDQPHDVEAETQMRFGAAIRAQGDHRFEQLARHRIRQARAAV